MLTGLNQVLVIVRIELSGHP